MAHTEQAHGEAHGHGEEFAAAHGHIGVRTYWVVFGGLMLLMILTVAAWWVEKNIFTIPEWLGVAIAMAIASAKTALIVVYFMHVKVSERITQFFAASAFVFLFILFAIVMGDYFARGWPPEVGPLP